MWFCPGNCWLKCCCDTFEIGPGLPTKTDRGAANTSQSILSRHLLGLENPQILTFNSAGIQSWWKEISTLICPSSLRSHLLTNWHRLIFARAACCRHTPMWYINLIDVYLKEANSKIAAKDTWINFSKANIIGYSGILIKCELAQVFLSVRVSLLLSPLFAMFLCVTCYYAPFPSVSRSHLTDCLPWRNCFKISMECVCKINVCLSYHVLFMCIVTFTHYTRVGPFPYSSHIGPTFSHDSCRLGVRGTWQWVGE